MAGTLLGAPIKAPLKRYFSLNFQTCKGTYKEFVFGVFWAESGDTRGWREDGNKLLQLTFVDGQTQEIPFSFSLEGKWSPVTGMEDPNLKFYAPGMIDIFVETEKDVRAYRILDRTTRAVFLKKTYPNAGTKPSVSVTIGAQNEVRIVPAQQPDRLDCRFSLNQGNEWFTTNDHKSSTWVTEGNKRYPPLPIEPGKTNQKIWIDVTLLFGLTVVHKQFEYTKDTGLVDVTASAKWIGPMPMGPGPSFYD